MIISYEDALVLALQSYLFHYVRYNDYEAVYLGYENTTQAQVDEYFVLKARAEQEKRALLKILSEI